mmetsp:Transcript_4062/g.7813  ORF Transcript_4062/g.7813 Transcript_4062/m.7813 type:complete len:587 (-) Transcript_4062:218-1978(-)
MTEQVVFRGRQRWRVISWDSLSFESNDSYLCSGFTNTRTDDDCRKGSGDNLFLRGLPANSYDGVPLQSRVFDIFSISSSSKHAHSVSDDEQENFPPKKKHRTANNTSERFVFPSFLPVMDQSIANDNKQARISTCGDVKLDALPIELFRQVLAFLHPSSLRSIAITNRRNMKLSFSKDLWKGHCLRQWPHIQDLSKNDAVALVCGQGSHKRCIKSKCATSADNVHGSFYYCPLGKKTQLPSHYSSPKYFEFRDHTNSLSEGPVVDFSILHGLACGFPRKIDSRFLMALLSGAPPVYRSYEMVVKCKSSCPAKLGVIQLVCPSHGSDRSICSDIPFPYLNRSNHCNWSNINTTEYLCRVGCTQLIKECCFTERSMKPFCAPYVLSATSNTVDTSLTNVEVDITPRLCAYFEVIISDRDLMKEKDTLCDYSSADFSGCIAVGLSYKNASNNRMVGYLGDDGGIYYAQGDFLSPFSVPFGVGDTVGCGLDYLNRTVFFTLNGLFLGNAFSNIDLCEKLYPSVGVDSMNPFVCNFGLNPFVFDLQSFCRNHKKLDFPSCTPSSTTTQPHCSPPVLQNGSIEHTVHQPRDL